MQLCVIFGQKMIINYIHYLIDFSVPFSKLMSTPNVLRDILGQMNQHEGAAESDINKVLYIVLKFYLRVNNGYLLYEILMIDERKDGWRKWGENWGEMREVTTKFLL